MSRSHEQLEVPRRIAAIYGSDRHLGDFPRSISMADFKAGPRTRRAQYGLGLHRVLPSVPDLRNLAHSQEGNARNTEYSLAHPPPIMFHQRRYAASNLPDERDFQECNHDEKRLRRKFRYESYQDLHILSMYQDDSTYLRSLTSTRHTDPLPAELNDPLSASYSDSGSSRSSSPAPQTPIDQRPLNETENEKRRFVHAKRLQLVEQRHIYNATEDEVEDEVEGEVEEDIIQVVVMFHEAENQV